MIAMAVVVAHAPPPVSWRWQCLLRDPQPPIKGAIWADYLDEVNEQLEQWFLAGCRGHVDFGGGWEGPSL